MRYTQKQLHLARRKREQARVNRDIKLQFKSLQRDMEQHSQQMRIQREALLNPMVTMRYI